MNRNEKCQHTERKEEKMDESRSMNSKSISSGMNESKVSSVSKPMSVSKVPKVSKISNGSKDSDLIDELFEDVLIDSSDSDFEETMIETSVHGHQSQSADQQKSESDGCTKNDDCIKNDDCKKTKWSKFKQTGNSEEAQAPIERKKIVLKKRESDKFDTLPEGWIEVTHFSGMPVYLHKSTRVCSMSKPYYLGPGSTRKHHIPISAIPCLQYRKEKEKETEEKERMEREEKEKMEREEKEKETKNEPESQVDPSNNGSISSSSSFTPSSSFSPSSSFASTCHKIDSCSGKNQMGGALIGNDCNQERTDSNSDPSLFNKDLQGSMSPAKDREEKLNDQRIVIPVSVTGEEREKQVTEERKNAEENEREKGENEREKEEKVEKSDERRKGLKRSIDGQLVNHEGQVSTIRSIDSSPDPLITGMRSGSSETGHYFCPLTGQQKSFKTTFSINESGSSSSTANQSADSKISQSADSKINQSADSKINQSAVQTGQLSGHNKSPNKRTKFSSHSNPNKLNSNQGTSHKLRTPIGSVRVESVEESRKKNSLNCAAIREYCSKVFEFQEITVKKFKTWKDRRAHITAKKLQERPSLPEGTKLITCPLIPPSGVEGVGRNYKKEFVLNPVGKSPICILHEFIQWTEKVQPKYKFRDLENAATPYSATVVINDMDYGTGYGASKKQAKLAAAFEALKIFMPDYVAQEEEAKRTKSSAAGSSAGQLTTPPPAPSVSFHSDNQPTTECKVTTNESAPPIVYRKKTDTKRKRDADTRKDAEGKRDADTRRESGSKRDAEKIDTESMNRSQGSSSSSTVTGSENVPGNEVKGDRNESINKQSIRSTEAFEQDAIVPSVSSFNLNENILVNEPPSVNENVLVNELSVADENILMNEIEPDSEMRSESSSNIGSEVSEPGPSVSRTVSRTRSSVLIPSNSDHQAMDDIKLRLFDTIKITDQIVTKNCILAGEFPPYQILVECLKRNHGLGDMDIDFKQITDPVQLSELAPSARHRKVSSCGKGGKMWFKMTVGKHTATVYEDNKTIGKQVAAQKILQLIHPNIKTFGSLLRLYGRGSCLTPKEKKEEERKITELQSAACPNKPNYAILNKLKEEMGKLREIRTLDLLDTESVPSANLENVDL